jgi:hypothetical protein
VPIGSGCQKDTIFYLIQLAPAMIFRESLNYSGERRDYKYTPVKVVLT